MNRQARTLTRRCRFIISKESKSVQDRNPTVWDTEFANCLNPLLENVLKALDRSGVTTIVDTYEEFRDANYTEEDQAKSTDFWNVIVLDINIRFTEKADGTEQCINTIKF